MNKKVLVIVFFIAVSAIVNAENTPKDVVTSFGKALSAWCQSGDISYRIELERLCNGVKKCRVEDKIHADYQRKYGFVDDDKTFVLDSYLNMFQTLMSEGIRFNMSNITVETQDHYPNGQVLTFITADIRVSGKLNHTVKDLFLVRDDKISGIYSYSSQLGFKHLNGSLIEMLQSGQYVWCGTSGFRNGFAVLENENGREGVIDTKGDIIVPFIWDDVYFVGGVFAKGRNFIEDNNGFPKESESCSYDLRFRNRRVPFYEAVVFGDGNDEYAHFDNFINGWAIVRSVEGKYGYLKEDDWDYNNIHYYDLAHGFNEGWAVVRSVEGKYGYLEEDDRGNNIHYRYDLAHDFNDGYAWVKFNGKGAIINTQFQIIIQDNASFEICDGFYDGLARIKSKNNGKYGFINSKGIVVIPCEYDEASSFSCGLCIVGKYDENRESHNMLYGCIDSSGEIIIPMFFESFESYHDGFIKLRDKIKKGNDFMFNNKGELLFSANSIESFHDGLALFYNKGKCGFINKKGEIVIPPIYSLATPFVNGYSQVAKETYGPTGFIDTKGILVVPYIYDSPVACFENGIALIQKDGKVGLIDRFGNSIFFTNK